MINVGDDRVEEIYPENRGASYSVECGIPLSQRRVTVEIASADRTGRRREVEMNWVYNSAFEGHDVINL